MAEKQDSDSQCSGDLKQEMVATVPEPSEKLTVESKAGGRETPSTVNVDVVLPMTKIQSSGPDVANSKEDPLEIDDSSGGTDVVESTDFVGTTAVSPVEGEDEQKEFLAKTPAVETSRADEPEDNQIPIEALLASGIAIDAEAVANEREEIELALKESGYWIEKQRELTKVLERMVIGFSAVLRKFELLHQTLSPKIRDELSSRAEGVKLCGRMLTRAHTKSSKTGKLTDFDEIKMPDALCLEILSAKVDAKLIKEVEKAIETHLKKRRIDNNRLISDLRQRVNSTEKNFLSVIERQVLPVIDGLDEGKKIGIGTIKSLIDRFPEAKEKLQGWFKIYDALITGMERELTKMGVQPFTASPGDVVDYDRYEPIDVEEDMDFDDEQIKETLRRGYLLGGIERGQEYVIRPGQVVIVKNSTED